MFKMIFYKSLFKQTSVSAVVLLVALIALNFKDNTAFVRQGPPSVVNGDKYSITAPLGWTHFTQMNNGFKVLYLTAPRADDFSPNLNVLMETTHGFSNDAYIKMSDDKMKKGGMLIDGTGWMVINGIRGRYATASFSYRGASIALKSYILIKDGTAYILTGSCLITQKDTYRPIFDSSVKTFRIK